ncbi:hypothetical protein CCL19_15475 [Pseudomonas syringae]|nr:hypothetical protein CCL19_15475 [Pseudomonas syringae]
MNCPLTKNRESAAPYAPKSPRVPRRLGAGGRIRRPKPVPAPASPAALQATCSDCAGSARQPDRRRYPAA